MMGERRVMQEALFYGFKIERHVPDNRSAARDFERAHGPAISPRLAVSGCSVSLVIFSFEQSAIAEGCCLTPPRMEMSRTAVLRAG